jgi:hypothetical protein
MSTEAQISANRTACAMLQINGRRVQGVKDAAELSRLIEEAKVFASKAVALNAVAPRRGGDPEPIR